MLGRQNPPTKEELSMPYQGILSIQLRRESIWMRTIMNSAESIDNDPPTPSGKAAR